MERALSVLEGRHPEHEKILRQTREAAEKRRGQIEIELAKKARTRLWRRLALAVMAVAAAATAAVAWKVAVRTRARSSALEASEAAWIARGFSRIASNELTGARTLDEDLPGSSCFVATSTVDGSVRVQPSGGAAAVGERSVAWCSCGAGHATIGAPPGEGAGLSLLRIDAVALGGPLARSWLDFAPGAWAGSGDECADAALDGWIASHRDPIVIPSAAWLDADPARAALRRAGLRLIAAVDPSHPFAVVSPAAGDCLLAISPSGETLSLRGAGGAWRVSHVHGALAWCSATAETLTVWRDGAGPVAVLEAPATRIGGLLGTRECAEAAGFPIVPDAAWLRGDDLPWEASAVLRASGLSDIASAPLRVDPGPPDAHVVALALAADASAVSEPEGVVIACDPPLSGGARETLCAHSAPVSWFNRKDAPAGAARGSLPVWLSPLEGRRELDAIARIPELLALTRRLAREGFEPTTLEGVTELADGVRIVGRAGEDAVVAVGLEPKPPWALPYFEATSGSVPWDLGDAPREVPLKPGDAVKLTSSPLATAPLAARRTVVFRHAMAP